MNSPRALAALVSVGVLLWGAAANAAEEPTSSPHVTVRAFGLTENGGSVQVATPDRTFSVEGGQSFVLGLSQSTMSLSDLAVRVRTPGATGWWVGGRIGYQFSWTSYKANPGHPDRAHGLDLGVMVGGTSQRGHSFLIEAGAETVQRAETYSCCDSVLQPSSAGLRVVLGGDLALLPHFALFARLGVATAEHVLEIKFLPIIEAGVALTF